VISLFLSLSLLTSTYVKVQRFNPYSKVLSVILILSIDIWSYIKLMQIVSRGENIQAEILKFIVSTKCSKRESCGVCECCYLCAGCGRICAGKTKPTAEGKAWARPIPDMDTCPHRLRQLRPTNQTQIPLSRCTNRAGSPLLSSLRSSPLLPCYILWMTATPVPLALLSSRPNKSEHLSRLLSDPSRG